MSNALAIALRTARRYGKQEGGAVELPEITVRPQPDQVSEEDIERARMNQANAPREGGLLQTIPQFWNQMQTPEGRSKLWGAASQVLGPDLPKNIVTSALGPPAEAYEKGLTPEQETDYAAGTTLGMAGSHMPFAGEGRIGVFGGRGSALHDREALDQATSMRHRNVNEEDIWNKTGWNWDQETKEPYFHIPMDQSKLHPNTPVHPDNPDHVWLPPAVTISLPKLLQDSNLYQHYPFLKDFKVVGADTFEDLAKQQNLGSYIPENKQIVVWPQSKESMLNTLVHETNHAVQDFENFAKGSNWRRFVPQGFQERVDALEARKKDMDAWLEKNGVNSDAVMRTVATQLRYPDLINQDQFNIISHLKKLGKYDDIFHMLQEADDYNAMKRQAQDNYWRSLGEIRSRESEWRRTLTPEESRLIPPRQAQQMIPVEPVPPGEEYIGAPQSLDYPPESARHEPPSPGGLAKQDKLGFYSRADELAAIGPKSATADQWIGYLKNKGLKAEEDQYLGLTDWLKQQQGPITREAVQQYARSNRIKLRETVADVTAEPQRLPEEWGGNPPGPGEEWTVPEIPQEPPAWNPAWDATTPGEEFYAEHPNIHPSQVVRHNDRVLPGGKNYREIKLSLQQPPSSIDYYHEHFPEDPNTVAYARMDERKINGRKTLFLHELQSDWHQAGNKFGYLEPEEEMSHEATFGADRVPEGPYKKVWPEMMFKRLIRYAVDNGFDQIAWPGQAEAVRQIEGWPNIAKTDKGYAIQRATSDGGTWNKDVSAVINRYLKDLPNVANKIGRPHNSIVVPGKIGNYDAHVLPLSNDLKRRAQVQGFSDFKRGGRIKVQTFARGGAAKATKKATHYRPGYGIRTCAHCTMFRLPRACTAVAGDISPDALCDLFKRKKR